MPKEIVEKDAAGREVRRTETATVIDEVPVQLTSSRIDVELTLDQRQKGLLWYATYGVVFRAQYVLRNPDNVERDAIVRLSFPASQAIYDGFVFRVNGVQAPPVGNLREGSITRVTLPPNELARVEVAYQSRGLGEWTYAFADSGVTQVQDFALDLHTDFTKIDFPAGTISPKEKVREGRGWQLRWDFQSLAAGQSIGLGLPNQQNPGPLAARITFFAPVSLLFFFTVMVTLDVLRKRSLHPVNYFFLAAAFFAFHLLLAYLVDHVRIHIAFLVAAATSIFLVVSYLRVVAGLRVALVEAGCAPLAFLVLFSYAFFFEGFTGLAITIGSIVTLFVLMQVTAKVDWSTVFRRNGELKQP
ncbi:MAG: cell envelope integrity protein CreD [Thermoanaerobaculaceae bacterium]|nr:cell envelope integrity protein CreD [Thermoanaerobaculaceae bacterium]